ncbi:MAG: PaeR7I family type II restriction endonuclease [Planctomycetaceae bacterium]
MKNLDRRVAEAVKQFWGTRAWQKRKQEAAGRADQGSRGAVTGGSQLDGFVELVAELLVECGLSPGTIFRKRSVELPGFFRPTKEWDLLVVAERDLLASIEFKSQVGPSFGNNFNNRTEEALGNATDLWTAYREGAFRTSPRPWLGYFMLLEEAPGSTSPVGVSEPHFEVFDEFRGASYALRYELFCRKLVRERLYDASCFLLSDAASGASGGYREPSPELSFRSFVASLTGHASGFLKLQE